MFSVDLLILMILRLSTLIQQAIQDHQQIIRVFAVNTLFESGYKSQKEKLLHWKAIRLFLTMTWIKHQ